MMSATPSRRAAGLLWEVEPIDGAALAGIGQRGRLRSLPLRLRSGARAAAASVPLRTGAQDHGGATTRAPPAREAPGRPEEGERSPSVDVPKLFELLERIL